MRHVSYHHGNLREALVEAAVELGRERGPDGIVIREVARRTGVSHNAAYRHFADRDELLHEVTQVGLDGLSAAMLARVKRVRVKDPVERARRRLREVGKAYVDYALAEPGLFAVAFSGPSFGDLTGPYQHLTDALDECLAVGYLPPAKREGAELTCWAGVHGFSMLHSTGPLRDVPRRQRDADLGRLLDRLDEALRA
ncbi:TetR/AcrR family transcriptional regulator [Nocardioides immobilis]|uniref:TetR/AcrR family transcriptional regulator n=1 Tax=Nocardioides immobilis TaxID=2049295 RepID=A0A417Y0C0_9ACTN|nr:TetR/AcrR family transcriptional regulator [Nocardioides immobilis]